MAEYKETVTDDDDPEALVLDALAKGQPYVFVVAKTLDPLDLRVATGHDLDVVRALLNQTIRALPPED